jgi:sensor histidine kinase regulating citrate/malate metabolism
MIHAMTMPWVIPTIFGCLVAIVAIVANVASATMKASAETNLKRRMVEQGYSVDEIERVIRATSNDDQQCAHDLPAHATASKPPKQSKSML